MPTTRSKAGKLPTAHQSAGSQKRQRGDELNHSCGGGDDQPPLAELAGDGADQSWLWPMQWSDAQLAAQPEDWQCLGVPPADLRLAATLMSGQSFRWERRLINGDGTNSARAQFPADLTLLAEGRAGPAGNVFVEYVGPVERHLFVLRETAESVFFRDVTIDHSRVSPHFRSEAVQRATDAARDCLRRYLRLPALPGAALDPGGTDRVALWKCWADVDPGLARRWAAFPGGRLLALPMLEAVICFVGSGAPPPHRPANRRAPDGRACNRSLAPWA
jgi:hypothetical protein